MSQSTEANHATIQADQEHFLAALRRDLSTIPLVLGFTHPAEETLRQGLTSCRSEQVCRWLTDFCANGQRPAIISGVIICLGNLPSPGTPAWRQQLIRSALESEHVEVRDAAVMAAELWEDGSLVQVLEAHDEPVEFLREYLRGVVRDLSA